MALCIDRVRFAIRKYLADPFLAVFIVVAGDRGLVIKLVAAKVRLAPLFQITAEQVTQTCASSFEFASSEKLKNAVWIIFVDNRGLRFVVDFGWQRVRQRQPRQHVMQLDGGLRLQGRVVRIVLSSRIFLVGLRFRLWVVVDDHGRFAIRSMNPCFPLPRFKTDSLLIMI